MMLDKVKNDILKRKGNLCKFRFNGVRNQNEEFMGIIVGIYPSVFTIKLENNIIRSFSYSDLLVNNIEILK